MTRSGSGRWTKHRTKYSYDGLSRLSTTQRGTLNSGHTGLTGTPTWEEDFNFDPIGNWHGTTSGYVTKSSGTTTLDQNRSNTKANEISGITTSSGTAWTVPAYDANGNATTIPQPGAVGSGFTCVYDAWNRLITIKNGGTTVATYLYDGMNRRVSKATSVTRDYYYSNKWQVLEERVSTPAPSCPERQFVWGLRYDDDLVLRDRVTGTSSSSTCLPANERLYVLHDYFNATAVVDTSGTVQERYGYDAYGTVRFMTSSFGSQSSSNVAWETLYGDYRWDSETGLYYVRNRYLHPKLGVWLTRDPLEYQDGINLYAYASDAPINLIDPNGTAVGLGCILFALDLLTPIGWILCLATVIVICGIVYLSLRKEPEPTCLPCPPVPPPRYDKVPPSRVHLPCPADHLHVFYYVQAPWPICKCALKKYVICLEAIS